MKRTTEDLLTEDHAALGADLDAALAALKSGDATASFQRLDAFWGLLAVHIRAENIHLIPAILSAAQAPRPPTAAPEEAKVNAAIARLRDDHYYFMKALSPMVKQLRTLANGHNLGTGAALADIREKLQAIQSRVEDHNAFEESHVYPWLSSLLEQTARHKLAQCIQANLNNLPQRMRS